VLAADGAGNRLLALTEGFQSGFLACIVLAGVGLLAVLLLLGPARRSPVDAAAALAGGPEPREPHPATEVGM
jgi:hypothetical protein